MKIIRSAGFTGEKAWDALDIVNMSGVTIRLHWTDEPYRWHVNDGEEVFVVLHGLVEMRYRHEGEETRVELGPGDIFFADAGTEHVAHPKEASRILVVEREGSI